MNVDDFWDYMFLFFFLWYLLDNYELVVKKELGVDYLQFEEDDKWILLIEWYKVNVVDIEIFEKQM